LGQRPIVQGCDGAARRHGRHDEQRDGIPAGRPGDAHQVGAVIAFLASPSASYVTGQSYTVDGGMLLMAAAANE
jgi:NAD(P)-dependent dehydrogenase (short-subunit alcohol dehydrogenase family)